LGSGTKSHLKHNHNAQTVEAERVRIAVGNVFDCKLI
jgi:hypothetical protein